MENQYIITLVTTKDKEEAERIAQKLLKSKLIACANIVGPISSHFHWEGKIEQVEEFLLLMKSQLNLFDKVSEEIKALHSYEVPEIIALPIVVGSKDYLAWLFTSLNVRAKTKPARTI